MKADGVRRAAVFATSAFAGYSSCRQYYEDIARISVDGGPELVKMRHFGDHPGFVEAMADHTGQALARLGRDDARLVFTAHSVPVSMARTAGPYGGLYEAQLRRSAELVNERLGRTQPWDLVWQSRSGPPEVPWLEPDVCDHLRKTDARSVVLVPIGFVSDHMEVVYDLDTEAAETANRLGLAFARASTPGVHPAFVGAVRDLVLERAAAERGEPVSRAAVGQIGAVWDVCAAGCCTNPRQPLPALGESSDGPRWA
jgi:ferrochelatase